MNQKDEKHTKIGSTDSKSNSMSVHWLLILRKRRSSMNPPSTYEAQLHESQQTCLLFVSCCDSDGCCGRRQDQREYRQHPKHRTSTFFWLDLSVSIFEIKVYIEY